MKDAKDLIGIDRAESKIIIGITAIVKVESAQQVCMQKPRDDLLYVLRGVVMPGVHQHPRLWPGLHGQMRSHAPVSDVGVIESRLKRLVLDYQSLLGAQRPGGL